MPETLSRLRSLWRRPGRSAAARTLESAQACSWDTMRAVYEEQARRGDPEAIKGLQLIDQDCWPSSGQPRGR